MRRYHFLDGTRAVRVSRTAGGYDGVAQMNLEVGDILFQPFVSYKDADEGLRDEVVREALDTKSHGRIFVLALELSQGKSSHSELFLAQVELCA